MIPLEEARALVCGAVEKLPVETVELLDAVGRVVAADQTSDIDVSPFAHSAMDGFALRAAEIADAAEESPAMLRVIAEIGAGDVFEGTIGEGECVRIMTGACLPADADAVVKYEIVGVVEGDVVTTGGAANGDFDFIKPVVAELGELLMTTVNMRPGKAQTFGIVEGTPVFGLPGNPAAAYVGFQMLIRPALRTMQGYRLMDHPVVKARLTADEKNRDPRRIYLRANLTRTAEGYEVTPAKNQSSGLFGPIQKTNCLAVMPEGTEPQPAGSIVDCLLLDIPEEVVL